MEIEFLHFDGNCLLGFAIEDIFLLLTFIYYEIYDILTGNLVAN